MNRVRPRRTCAIAVAYLGNVKGFKWNQLHVDRISRELELDLRIKPRRHLGREPMPLVVQAEITQT